MRGEPDGPAGEPRGPTRGVTPPLYARTWKPPTGGALIIIGGILGVIAGLLTLGLVGTQQGNQNLEQYGVPISQDLVKATAIVVIILDLVAMAGGIVATQRRLWGLAIAGGILGIILGGFIIGNILALIGTILVAISRREFAGRRAYVAERRMTGV